MSRRLDPSALALHLVTDAALSAPRTVPDVVAAAVAGGAGMVQVREKSASARDLVALLVAVAERVGRDVPVLVDDRADVYLAARAAGAPVAGVHVGQSDLPVELARRICGPEAVLGLSAATDEELAAAAALPAGTVDYLGVGAVRATRTKPDHPEPLGVEGFGRAASRTSLPCLAIGGVRVEDAPGLRAAGAAGLAVVSGICADPDPGAAAGRYLRAFHGLPAGVVA
ncbi:thiamine-phosphate synthase [Kocuria dechangensis]|uniref:Thiamine-phosphate synthase n=1 Tax=Kocuria dechangensis TaxID=1176249 RepID=A0A917LVW5_9MICC|nr:thiamine phosphate synthase [Kocuria dechangensis]GGG61892.1 thiamine-phosphate synthase [Kocuria dechangensis]